VARITQLSLGVVFHISRIIGAVILFWNLHCFWYEVFSDNGSRRLALVLSALGSGMGWLAIPFGEVTADFWVPETYPFLSSYVNPHFPLGLALVLWLIKSEWKQNNNRKKYYLWKILAGAFIVSVINPFGIVVVLMVLGGDQVRKWVIIEIDNPSVRKYWSSLDQRLIWILFAAGPVVFYYFWIANSDPVFIGWNTQNLTPSPALWDLFLSLSPALLLAFVGMGVFWSSKNQLHKSVSSNISLLVVWLVLGILLLYFPFSLQRRFMMGLYVPAVGLAVLGLEKIRAWRPDWYRIFFLVVFIFAIPTNLVIFMTGFYGAQNHDPQLYLSVSETKAFEWLKKNTGYDSLVLASPDSGLFIPAYTGRRVIYGHPFETVNADTEEENVVNYFAGNLTNNQMEIFLENRDVDYVFYGNREKDLGNISLIGKLVPEYSNEGVTIFRVSE
jgi:hypothetical protein